MLNHRKLFKLGTTWLGMKIGLPELVGMAISGTNPEDLVRMKGRMESGDGKKRGHDC